MEWRETRRSSEHSECWEESEMKEKGSGEAETKRVREIELNTAGRTTKPRRTQFIFYVTGDWRSCSIQKSRGNGLKGRRNG